MAKKANYFKIGIFVISAVILAVIAVIILGAGTLFHKSILIETYFKESVQGLDVGSSFDFRGFRIGKVEEITLVSNVYPTDYQYILVRASIAANTFRRKNMSDTRLILKDEISKGLRIRLSFQGLTGAVYLEADYLDPLLNQPLEIDWEPRYTYVPSAPSVITRVGVALDKIMRELEKTNFQEIAEKLEKSLQAVTGTLKEAHMDKISAQAEKLIEEVRGTNRRMDRILSKPEIDSILLDASATIAAARKTVEGAEVPLSQTLKNLSETSLKFKDLSIKLDAFSGELPPALSDLKNILRRLEILIYTQQDNIETSVRNIRQFTENLKEMSEEVKNEPSLLLFGSQPRTREEK